MTQDTADTDHGEVDCAAGSILTKRINYGAED